MILNQLTGELTFFTVGGASLSSTVQPNVNSGAVIQAGNSSRVNNVNSFGDTFTGADVADTADTFPSDGTWGVGALDPAVWYSIGLSVSQSSLVTNRDKTAVTGYIDGVARAVRSGFWNIYSGTFSTAPTGSTIAWATQVQSKYVNYMGSGLTLDY